MKRIQPHSLLRLTLLGFVLVALPLVGAIVTAIVQVDSFARDNRQALVSVQQNANASRTLAARITELERTARQYHALTDNTYKDLYVEHRVEIRSMLQRLIDANSDPRLLQNLVRAEAAEQASNKVVEAINTGATAAELESAFVTMREAFVSVVQSHNEIARELGNSMPERASALQRLLMGQAALVIPFSIGLIILFGVLIARPVRQIDRGIRALGRGALRKPIRVSGAGDLEELGFRLDWLRLRLIELEAQKAQFLRNVSHELKTPLTNIREGAELLLEDSIEYAVETEKGSIAHILRNNSLRLQQMIEALLRYGADGDLRPEQMSEDVQLDQLVDDVIEQSQLALAARSVSLCATLKPVVVEGNARRLRIIIDNLISNAVKYTPLSGEIRVDLSATADATLLDVRDSGPGIREQDTPHLFEWFYTGPRQAGAILKATGMGLAIAQEYAHQHGGHIQLKESSIGAHFRLTLREGEYV